MAMTTRQVVVAAPPRRADVVVQELTGMSRAAIRGLFDHDCVRVDGRAATAGEVVAPGAAVVVTWDAARRYKEKPKAPASRAFRLVFEDAHGYDVPSRALLAQLVAMPGESTVLVTAQHPEAIPVEVEVLDSEGARLK